ncbi:MAG: hypothetical protein HWD86_01670 [Kangiellaceae bacterium]|nr:hypothetical protein [Kangiellaceae bacterium]
MTKKQQTLSIIGVSIAAAVLMLAASFFVSSENFVLILGTITAVWFIPYWYLCFKETTDNSKQ